MRKLMMHEFMTLDGVVQAPGAPDEDTEGGFELGGWIIPHWDEQLGEIITGWIGEAGALLLGRKTYEIFAGHWPHVGDEDPIAAVYNRIPKYVVSRNLASAGWAGTTIIRDVAAEVARLKESEGGEIQITGSSELAQTLLAHDLIDEFRLVVVPGLAGTGKRLFNGESTPRGLRLIESRALPTGVTINTYQRAGEFEVGVFNPEDFASSAG
jgi:dihydrofolate reductase